ncbi:hypothetical protein [Salsipaludibacter albus]|uniref:hypothetical protein n=1 Tax=Salsipaludibacter albus TaxID=2849650 RepID=UPI001EE3E069|nr:hypothetical protein [Salsipaludibacter albus]MBY5162070.1 hypothetical protein [Salsipaludibacter albus]
MPSSTSFRFEDATREQLASLAKDHGVSATDVLSRLIHEAHATRDHPMVVFRGPAHRRRAGLAGGPDVWEVVARMRELSGSEDERIGQLTTEAPLQPVQVEQALAYAAAHRDEVMAMVEANEAAVEASQQLAAERRALYR